MDNRSLLSEDELERHRALVKLLQYVERECSQAGYQTTSWLIGMSIDMLYSELTEQPSVYFDRCGHPQFH